MSMRKETARETKNIRTNIAQPTKLSSLGLDEQSCALLRTISCQTFITQELVDLLYPQSESDLVSLLNNEMIARLDGQYALTRFGWTMLEVARLITDRSAAA